MSAGPRTPEMGTPEQQVVDKRGGAVKAIGAMFRSIRPDRATIQEGKGIKRNTEAFNNGRKAYDEATAGRGDAATKEAARAALVDAAKNFVSVTDTTPLRLTPEEQRYVDAVVVASAQRVVDTMPRTTLGGENPWRMGAYLQRAERFGEQRPNLTVVRTPDGLQVMVTTGAGGTGPDGSVQFNGAAGFVTVDKDGNREEPEDKDKQAARVNVRQYSFKQGEPGTARAGRVDSMTVVDRNGTSQEYSVVDNGQDGFGSVQRTVDTAQVSHQSYYQQSGEVQVGGQTYELHVVSQDAAMTQDQAREAAQRYLDNGGVAVPEPQPDGSVKQVVTLFSGTDVQRQQVYPVNPDGLHIAGITSRDQINIESAAATAQRTVASGEQARNFAETLREPGFVDMQTMAARIPDRNAALVAIAAVGGTNPEQLKDRVEEMVRQQGILLSRMPRGQAEERAFAAVLGGLRALVPAGTLTRNQENALWRAAEVYATGLDARYLATDQDLMQKVQSVTRSAEGSQEQKQRDVVYLINRTRLDARAKQVLIRDYSENATGAQQYDFAKALREAGQRGEVDLTGLPPEVAQYMEAGEVLPSTADAAVTRLFAEEPRRDESPAQYRARLDQLAGQLNFGNPDATTALVNAAMKSHQMDAVSQRALMADVVDTLEQTGNISAEAAQRLRDAQQFSAEEGSAMRGVMGVAESLPPTQAELDNPDRYADRVRRAVDQLGLTTDQADRFAEMVMTLNGMDEVSRDQRAADRLLETYGETPDTADSLPPRQYLRYLTLTRASAEQVVGAVGSYVAENPQDLGPLRDLARDYPALKPVVDGLLYSAFARDFAQGDDESAEDRRNRLVARAGELSGLASNPGEMRSALMAMVPELRASDANSVLGVADGVQDKNAAAALVGLLTAKFNLGNQSGRNNR